MRAMRYDLLCRYVEQGLNATPTGSGLKRSAQALPSVEGPLTNSPDQFSNAALFELLNAVDILCLHVDRDESSCKIWLSPVAESGNVGFVQINAVTILKLWRYGESSMVYPGERITNVHCTDDELVVSLAYGRSISAPLAWYPRLLYATPAEREDWKIAGAGFGIHWPSLDEDLKRCRAATRRSGATAGNLYRLMHNPPRRLPEEATTAHIQATNT